MELSQKPNAMTTLHQNTILVSTKLQQHPKSGISSTSPRMLGLVFNLFLQVQLLLIHLCILGDSPICISNQYFLVN
jgi:hypothetical protein